MRFDPSSNPGRRIGPRSVDAAGSAVVSIGRPASASASGYTRSHQFAVEAARFGGGQTASKRLRRANILAGGIALPIDEVPGDLNGLRLGTPVVTRFGMQPADMRQVARCIARVLIGNETPEQVAGEVGAWRAGLRDIGWVTAAA